MPDFVNGGALIAAVQRVLGGSNLRCAVAFWGDDADVFLREHCEAAAEARIVCDIEMGATSPRTLKRLGTPTNPRLRQQPYLHAKVYLSDAGAVVGSANMSANALGFGGKVKHRETAVVLEPRSDEFVAAGEWFDTLYNGSDPIDAQALRRAKRRYRPGRAMIPDLPVRNGSILDLVMSNPEAFGGVGFVFSDEMASEKEIHRARRSAKTAHPELSDEIDAWLEERMFTGWDAKSVRTWPGLCIEYFRPGGELQVFFQTLRLRTDRDVFTADGRSAIQAEMGMRPPAAAKIENADDSVVARLLKKKRGRVFRTAHALREALIDLE